MNRRSRLFASAFVLVMACLPAAAAAATCDGLSTLQLRNTTITSAETIAAGAFTLPADSPRSDASFFTAFETLAAFCRVKGVIAPARGSHIEFEVWLPESGWNGKYVGAGNGGYGGLINYYRLAEAVNAGYAGSATDTGHRGAANDWIRDHPEQVIDFNSRAIHETAEKTKAIIRAFYGESVKGSYFNSCSNGGRQALVEALRYPADYDGIMAGAPTFSLNLGRDKASLSDPNLKAFKDRGGKLILYHGADDGPAPTLIYYQRLVSRLGKESVNDFVRLYAIPEMGHCGGGPVPDFGLRLERETDAQHSMARALERWVETGAAPEALIATKYETDGDRSSHVVRTRPLCPYPQQARWSGRGSADEAANFVCRPKP